MTKVSIVIVKTKYLLTRSDIFFIYASYILVLQYISHMDSLCADQILYNDCYCALKTHIVNDSLLRRWKPCYYIDETITCKRTPKKVNLLV